MTGARDPQDLEARFERELARDRAVLGFLNHATLVASLLTVAILITLVIPMGRTSPWLVGLTFYGAATRLCVFVARYALGLPLFLLDLESDDLRTRAAAREVFERNREALATTLLTQGNERPTATQLRELDPAEAAAIARRRDLPARRRNAAICAAVWIVVSIVVWSAVVATGGGPTSLTGSR